MKLPLILMATALPAAAINPRHTYTTPAELQGFGDFNADSRLDVVVIDRPTGLHRVGLGQPDGSLIWQAPKPTGCPDAEALAVGPVVSATSDQIVVTGKSANQLFIIDPSAPYVRPWVHTPQGIGPAAVAAVDLSLPGNDPTLLDLVTATHWNSAPNTHQRQLVQSLSSGPVDAGTINTGSPLADLARVQLDTAGPEHFAAVLRGGTDQLRLIDATDPLLPLLGSLPGLSLGSDFVHAPFLGSALSQFVLFTPGTEDILYSPWSGTALASPVSKNTGPDPVFVVNLIDDGTHLGIAVIYNDGSHAGLFHFDASGNLIPDGAIHPPAGETLNGILCHTPGHFAALSGPPGTGSTTTTPYSHDGSDWVAGTPESLDPLDTVSTRANVFVYDKEPLVNDDARLVETFQVPDWSSTFTLTLSGGGGPAGMALTVETFDGEASGLDNPATTSVPGLPPAGLSSKALINQNQPEVAVSSTSGTLGIVPIQISIDPPAGTYTRYVAPELVVPDPTGIDAFYRTSLADPWTTYTFGTAITPPGDTLEPFTVWFYAEDSSSGRRSPVHQADYAFTGEPGELDSDGDGVPDFVEIQKGLDPLAGPDSDEDGLTDLEELLYGSDPANDAETATYGGDVLDLPPSRTNDEDGDGHSDFAEWTAGSNPFDAGDTPAADALAEYGNTFDLNVLPLSHSGSPGDPPDRKSFAIGDPTFSPTDVRAHDLGARLLATAPTGNHGGGTLADPHARLTSLPATGRDEFVIVSTPATFDCENPDDSPGTGRELIGLVPIPSLDAGPVPFTGSASSTAADWISAAQAHYASLPRATIDQTLDLHDTLAYLLWERLAGELLTDRGLLTGPLPLGLATFRDTVEDESQTATADDLLQLQSYVDAGDPGILLQQLAAAITAEIDSPTSVTTSALKQLANQIYQLSAAQADEDRGLFPSPFETLRDIVRHLPTDPGDLDGLIPLPGDDPTTPISYAGGHTLGTAGIVRAEQALIHLLTLVPGRPTATYSAEVTATSFATPVPVLEDSTSGAGLRLFDADGDPFVFPQSLDLPAGTTLEVLAFTDRTDLPAGDGTALETISATITGFPEGTPGDLNQNAIDDEYEDYFFGGPVDPFGDEDGDGYINLQEALDGTHPADAASTPGGTPLPDAPPPVEVAVSGGDLVFTLEFPSEYGDRIHFLLQGSGTSLSAAFIESTDAATDSGSNEYTLSIPKPSETRSFYRFRLGLRP
ncbi:hypothetical protein [Haloferula sp. A504]|uniref:hypothetical protein n=1 Tax=Haloferula sp. A504 TaxID=3373601 RepID=UPI0031C5F4D0|nr:hypothetical protein [Verrucomicrobiaceae bacterium E54]